MKLSYNDLQNYRNYQRELNSYFLEIENMYEHTNSRSVVQISSHNNNHDFKDSTLQAIEKIDKRKRDVEERIEFLNKKITEITNWVDAIPNHEINAIARTHFLCGYSWRETTDKLYGVQASWNLSAIAFKRWLTKNKNLIE